MNASTQNNLDVLSVLTNFTGSLCVSLYLPAHPAGGDIEGDAITLRKLIHRAEEKLVERGENYSTIELLLAPARQLLYDRRNRQGGHQGLALFLAPGFFRLIESPTAFPPLAVVGDRFHLLPLFPLVEGDGRYYFLVLSGHGSRLFKGSRQTFHQVWIPEIARSLAEFQRGTLRERQLQIHTGVRPPQRNMAGRGGGIFHGGSSSRDRRKQEMLDYCRSVEREVRKYLGATNAPLVLGGVAYLTALYRQVTSYGNIMEEEVSGSLDHLDRRQLHEGSWKVVEPYFEDSRRMALQKLRQLMGTGLASTDSGEVLGAADHGRVESLFLAPAGRVEESVAEENVVDALVNLAAIETLTTGGHVFSLAPGSIETEAPMAAIFRY